MTFSFLNEFIKSYMNRVLNDFNILAPEKLVINTRRKRNKIIRKDRNLSSLHLMFS